MLSMTDEDRWYATAAALLDPRCYTMASTVAGGLDLTVPEGHTWHVTNAFAVQYNTPQIVAQDAFPGARRSGFLRPLDARRAFPLSSGTHVRNNGFGTSYQTNTAYLFYADAHDVWCSDARYMTDPRSLYYERLARLQTLPISEVVLEATGGGAIDDDVHADLPEFGCAMVVGCSVYDTCWMTLGWTSNPGAPLNLLNEINNSHAVRFAESLMQPIRWDGGVRVALCKGSNADTPGSTNAAIAYPIHGSASLLYQVLPTDW